MVSISPSETNQIRHACLKGANMIDVEREDLVQFPEARGAFPGRKIALATLHRWRMHGVRGTKLETCLVGGLRYTSKQAILRFVEQQNRDQQPAPAITGKQRRRQAEAANRILEQAGI